MFASTACRVLLYGPCEPGLSGWMNRSFMISFYFQVPSVGSSGARNARSHLIIQEAA